MKKALLLRTCDADLTSHGDFQWPASGPVEAPDWDPRPICGWGLHGLLWGEGSVEHLSCDPAAKWLVVEVDAAEVVDLDGKVKVPRGEVVYCGDQDGATEYLLDHGGQGRAIVRARVSAGDHGTATAGYGGTATAGDEGTATAGNYGRASAGYGGTATVGNGGTATAGHYGRASAGDRGTATAGAYGTATAGDGGTAAAGYSGTATAGAEGTATVGAYGTATAGAYGTATAGDGGTAAAGAGGTIVLHWNDVTRKRVIVAYVGEKGIEPDVAYRVQGRVLVSAERE